MKRIFDLILAIFLFLVLLISLLLIAVLVIATSKGPVLYWSDRIGKNNKIFKMPKFRSMLIDTPTVATHLLDNPDSYLSPIGGFLRRSSLDELPQLFNVIKGNMSLVGPRPNVFAQQELYSKSEWEKRNSVRPGITGLAQALIRSSGTPDERTRLDLKYVEKQSLFYDIYIIMLTIKQVLFKGDTN